MADCRLRPWMPAIDNYGRYRTLLVVKLEKVIETEAMLLNEANLTNSKCISRLGMLQYELSCSDWLFSDESD